MLLLYWFGFFILLTILISFNSFRNIGEGTIFFENAKELEDMCWGGLRRGPQ